MATLSAIPIRSGLLYVGVDVGKAHHWVCVVDQDGTPLLSKKVLNDETQIREAITEISGLGGSLWWAVDIIGTLSSLLLALLAETGQQVSYASGRVGDE